MRDAEYAAMGALEDVHWWYRALRDLVEERLAGAERVLDAGCGTGGMAARLGVRLAAAVDLSGRALSLARERGVSPLVRGDGCSLPFRDGAFDAVLSLDVIYHRHVASDARAVAECARVLRPGGVLILHAPAYPSLSGSHDRAVHGARRYTRKGIGELVEGAGLVAEELSYRNLPVLPLAAAVRLLRRGRRGDPEGRGGSDLRPVHPWVNGAAFLLARGENALLRRLSLPAGLSVWCVARKPCPA